jgi:DUF1009 family protein
MTAGAQQSIGLIAGQGALPIETARGLRAAGFRVVCAALSGQPNEEELRPLCDIYKKVGLIRINQWIRVLKRYGCKEAVMVGRVGKSEIYQRWHLFRYLPDWRSARVWFIRLRHDKRNDAMLRAVADELASGGVHLIDGRRFVPDSMATDGVMTRKAPGADVAADIEFAWPLLKKLNELLIGQAVACRDREIVAVEAVEGTDRLIERAGSLVKRGHWTLCKAANPNQDMRFDVPTVGIATIENLAKNKAAALVVETGRVIMLEKEKLLARADELGIAVVGRS